MTLVSPVLHPSTKDFNIHKSYQTNQQENLTVNTKPSHTLCYSQTVGVKEKRDKVVQNLSRKFRVSFPKKISKNKKNQIIINGIKDEGDAPQVQLSEDQKLENLKNSIASKYKRVRTKLGYIPQKYNQEEKLSKAKRILKINKANQFWEDKQREAADIINIEEVQSLIHSHDLKQKGSLHQKLYRKYAILNRFIKEVEAYTYSLNDSL